MANRSKKVVLSARVDPYLKAALELLAASRNEKIVKILESCLENGMNDRTITNPFNAPRKDLGTISFMVAFTSIWSENETLYKLRAGTLGPDFAGEELSMVAMVINDDKYFDGEFDVFGDLNGSTEKFGFTPRMQPRVDLALVEKEWPIVEEYVRFLANNKPLQPGYADYKNMRAQSLAK
ncbi:MULTISPECIES: hypothetical protein [unclassified Pseudomonas]|uniref:hypothetical protein n=1 Tax=unclassified Pseudomonas TaxID=196821 RepID=UPI000F55FDF6|nr:MULTISPECIES: hypothetical protein [unclassified Pseudomonas]AZF49172.1 hypothetical protein C4J86_3960 [Pseudomonas sp. R2-7-07]AZF59658.1 hypothetical protein C4J84_3804 [Pseudomonas sp. R11-23-07]